MSVGATRTVEATGNHAFTGTNATVEVVWTTRYEGEVAASVIDHTNGDQRATAILTPDEAALLANALTVAADKLRTWGAAGPP